MQGLVAKKLGAELGFQHEVQRVVACSHTP